MAEDLPGHGKPVLGVFSYRTESGNEPVRLWLKGLGREDHRPRCQDGTIRLASWNAADQETGAGPVVRSQTSQGIARVLFTVSDGVMVLLHGFIKKSQKTPLNDLRTARQRLADLSKE